MHGVGIEWLIDPPGPIAMQRGSLRPVKNAVTVTSGRRRKPRMKLIVDGLSPNDVDVVGKIAVRAKQPAAPAAFTGGVEMNDLAGGVHTGIGAACADYLYRFICNQRERFLEALLDANTGFLTLPAVIPRAVVLDAERNANDGTLALQGVE